MIVKNGFVVTSVVTGLLLCMPSQVKANQINSYEDYKLYCSPHVYLYGAQSPYCNQYDEIYKNRLQEELNQQQNRRRDTQQENNSAKQADQIRGYVGGSLGAFFPTESVELIKGGTIDEEEIIDEEETILGVPISEIREIDLNTGFGGSLFVGAKLDKNIGTDLEFVLLGGGTEFDDLGYSQWGLFINPRFILPLTNQENSIFFFVSPGLGLSKGKLNYDIPDEVAEELGTEEGLSVSLEDDISFTWQIKLGLSFPLDERGRWRGFTQGRYVNPTGENTINVLSAEVGVALEF